MEKGLAIVNRKTAQSVLSTTVLSTLAFLVMLCLTGVDPAGFSMLPAGASAQTTAGSQSLLSGANSLKLTSHAFAESAPWFTRLPRLQTGDLLGGASCGALVSADNRAAFGRAPPPFAA